MDYTIQMEFNTDLGQTTQRLNINRADPTKTDAQVITAMDAIIATGLLSSVAGYPISRSSARLVSTDTIDYSIV